MRPWWFAEVDAVALVERFPALSPADLGQAAAAVQSGVVAADLLVLMLVSRGAAPADGQVIHEELRRLRDRARA
jgi:hypothetical protein